MADPVLFTQLKAITAVRSTVGDPSGAATERWTDAEIADYLDRANMAVVLDTGTALRTQWDFNLSDGVQEYVMDKNFVEATSVKWWRAGSQSDQRELYYLTQRQWERCTHGTRSLLELRLTTRSGTSSVRIPRLPISHRSSSSVRSQERTRMGTRFGFGESRLLMSWSLPTRRTWNSRVIISRLPSPSQRPWSSGMMTSQGGLRPWRLVTRGSSRRSGWTSRGSIGLVARESSLVSPG